MFLENPVNAQSQHGWIEVVTGSMFSGKTEELIRRMKRAKIARQHILIFKPAFDDRYSKEKVISHDANEIPSTPVSDVEKIPALAEEYTVVGVDEAQFFDPKIVEICSTLADQGKRVIVAGLDMDFQGKPFGPMPQLMAIAEYVTKVHAVCMRCGALAQFSHRLSADDELVLLGEKDKYEPLCRKCYHEIRYPNKEIVNHD